MIDDSTSRTAATVRVTPVIAIGLSFFIGNLDATVVNVATTQIGRELSASTTSVAWTINGFVLAVAALLLFAGDMARRVGARRIYIFGLCLFTVSSVVAGLAPVIEVLIAARVFQGIGSALFQPAGLILLAASYPNVLTRQRMIGLWAAMGAIAAALGPMIGGFIVGGLGWRWIFWINVPVGIVTVWLSSHALPRLAPDVFAIPFLGHGLFALSMTGTAVALMEGPDQGWTSGIALAAIVVAVGSFLGFVLWQYRSDMEVYPSRVLRNRQFSLTNVVGIFMNIGMFGDVFLISIMLQQYMGSGPLVAGVQLLPMMCGFVIGNLFFTRIGGRLGARRAVILGMGSAGIAVAMLAAISVNGFSYPWLAAAIGVAHLGLGIASPAMTAEMMESVTTVDRGLAGAILNVNRSIGSLIGVAIAAGLLTTAKPASAASAMFAITAIGYFIATWAGFMFSERG